MAMMKSLLLLTATRRGRNNVQRSGRRLSSLTPPATKMITTPAEAGKRAKDLAASSEASSSETRTINTMLAHAGVNKASSISKKGGRENLALAPSLEFATTYTRPAEGPYQEGSSIYTREDNPTRRLLEETVSNLECSFLPQKNSNTDYNKVAIIEENNNDVNSSMTTCAFASGMMAASSILLAHESPITVILPQDLYHGVSTVMTDVFQARFGVEVRYVDMVGNDNDGEQHHALQQELTHVLTTTRHATSGGSVIVWMESPSNPCCHVLDIQSICAMVNGISAQQQSSTNNMSSTTVTTVVDSTLAPPVIQQPLQLGVDVVMHSGTKYFGGHSDVLLGITTASPFTAQGRRLAPLIRQVQQCVGGVASPMDSWLTLRGLRTLHVRVERQCQTAMALAEHLSDRIHDGASSSLLVTAVHYPGLPSHPNHSVAKRQMKNGRLGGVLSIELKSEHMAMAFAGALQTIHRATSLGGTETLIEHRASIEPPNRVTSPPGLLRIAVGLEDSSDLIRDIDRALLIAQQVEQEMV